MEFKGRDVVIDTSTPLLYIGRLEDASEHFLVIVECDVHDLAEGSSTKEVYCIEAKKYGIKKNRRRVMVRRDIIASISLLDDVIEY